MMRIRPARQGLSLLEALVSVAILLISFAAIYSLLDVAGTHARIVRDQSLAIQVCQSKMNELMAGSLGMSGESGSCDELPGWEYVIEADPYEVQGLYKVKVTVRRENNQSPETETVLEAILLDPSLRGSVFDQPPSTANTDSSSGTDSSSSGSTSGSSGGASSGGSSGGSKPSGGSSGGGSSGGATGGGGSRPSGGSSGGGSSGGSRPSGGSSGGSSGGGRPSGGSTGGGR